MSYLFRLLPDSTTGVQLPPGRRSLGLWDTDASHLLKVAPGSNLTADRTLTLTTGDSDRILTLSGNPTLGDWFNQPLKTTSTPTFSNTVITNAVAASLTISSPSSFLQLTDTDDGNSWRFAANAGHLYFYDASSTRVPIWIKPGLPEKFLNLLGAGTAAIGSFTVDAAAVNALLLKNGTAPSAGVLDSSQFYSADITAGNAAPHFKTEAGNVIKLYRTATGYTTFANLSTLRTLDVSTATLAQVANVLGSLIVDMKLTGLIAA